MEHKFKVGDRVRKVVNSTRQSDFVPKGTEGIVSFVTGDGDASDFFVLDTADRQQHASQRVSEYTHLVGRSGNAASGTKFALQFDIGIAATELFATLPEVRARIKELAARTDLNRDSIKLYHISKVEKIELSTAITFTPAEAPKKKARKA
jgi:hypothetical protein